MSQHSDGISKTSLAKAIGYDCKWNYISTSGSSRGYKGKHDINPPSLAAQVLSWSINQLTVLAAIFVATFLSDIRSGELTFEIEFELQNELELKQENGLLKKRVSSNYLSKGLGHPPCCMWPSTLLLTWVWKTLTAQFITQFTAQYTAQFNAQWSTMSYTMEHNLTCL